MRFRGRSLFLVALLGTVAPSAGAWDLWPIQALILERQSCREVVWIDVSNSAPQAFEGAIDEASRILEGVGLRFRYRRGDAGEETEPDQMKIVVLARPAAPPVPGRLVMGAVNRVHETGQERPVWVFVEPLLSTLGLRSVTEDPPTVARALGRVIAHELIHVSAPHLGHARYGLMAPVLRAKDLIGSIDIDPETRRALHDVRPLLAEQRVRVAAR